MGAGDTLQSIARSAYGDSALWYRLAEANGLGSNNDLKVGQSLTIPNRVDSQSNSASTFKPYNPSDVTGSTTPNVEVPQPKGEDDDCGGFGQILVAVVVVFVAVVTQQYYLVEFAGEAAVTAGTVSTGTTIASGAAAGATASIAGQIVGNALGIQNGFSWKQVALSAVGGGISAGIGGIGGQGGVNFTGATEGASTLGNRIIQGAVGNALTQGVGVVTGLQERFDWRGVAASAAGAGVGQAVGSSLGGVNFGLNDFGNQFVRSTLTGLAAGTTAAVMRGGRVSVQQIATDAFGNALGSSLAGGSFSGSQNEAVLQGAGPWSERDYVNGMDLQSDNYGRPSTSGAGWSGTGLRMPNGSGQPGLYNTPAAMGAFNDGYDIARGERLLTEARDRDIDFMTTRARAEAQASRNAIRAQASSSRGEYDKALSQLSALSQGPADRMGAASGPTRIQTAGNFATRGVPSLDDMTLSPTASSPGNINSTFSLNGSGSGARPIDMLVDTAKAAYNDPLRAAKNVILGVAQGGIGFVGDAVKGYAMMGDLAFNGGQNIGAIDRFSVRPFAYDADMGLLGVAGEMASPAAYVKLAQLGEQGLRVAAPVAQEMWATTGERLLAPRTINPQFGGVFVGDGVAGSAISNDARLIGGRSPINSRYAGDTYPLNKLPPALQQKYPDSVRFNSEGFPDFSPYAKAKVEMQGLTGNYKMDAALANQAVGLKLTPKNYAWHHVEDGLTIQLIPKDIHNAVRHTGGSAVIRYSGK